MEMCDDCGFSKAECLCPCQPIGCDAGIHLPGCKFQMCPICAIYDGHRADCPVTVLAQERREADDYYKYEGKRLDG